MKEVKIEKNLSSLFLEFWENDEPTNEWLLVTEEDIKTIRDACNEFLKQPKEEVEKSCKTCKYEDVNQNSKPCHKCNWQVCGYTEWQPKEEVEKSCYGYCPICGAKGVNRERRIDGNDVCENGHTYKSKDAKEQQEDKPKKLKLRMSEKKLKKIQAEICVGCKCTEDVCNNSCEFNLKRYVKGEK